MNLPPRHPTERETMRDGAVVEMLTPAAMTEVLRRKLTAWTLEGEKPAGAAQITREILAHIRNHLHPSSEIRGDLLRLESSTRYSDLGKLKRAANLLERAQGVCIPSGKVTV